MEMSRGERRLRGVAVATCMKLDPIQAPDQDQGFAFPVLGSDFECCCALWISLLADLREGWFICNGNRYPIRLITHCRRH